MLDPKIERKLESLTQIPTIPFVISEVLQAVDDPRSGAAHLANLIERDQAMTAKVLAVANSPFYGFSRKIATIDLAVVVMGTNTIKEILLSLAIQRFFSNVRRDIFDVRSFWRYSLFCGAAARLLARRLEYRIPGEAFVAGLMHDIGVLILVQYFSQQFIQLRRLQEKYGLSMVEAEKKALRSTHSEIGAWIAEKWQLPAALCKAIERHHTPIEIAGEDPDKFEIDEPLTLLVSLSEWFAGEMGFKEWSRESKPSTLFMQDEVIESLKSHDLLNPESAFEALKLEIEQEFEKSLIFGPFHNS